MLMPLSLDCLVEMIHGRLFLPEVVDDSLLNQVVYIISVKAT